MQEPFQKQKRSSKVIFSPTEQPSDIAISCHVTQKLGNLNYALLQNEETYQGKNL